MKPKRNAAFWKEAADEAIRRDFLSQRIEPWGGEELIYHGTPVDGMTAMLTEGFRCGESHDLDFYLLSTSRNDNVLSLFSENRNRTATGFAFLPRFQSILILDEFWYYALYGMSESGAVDMWFDYIERNTEALQRAESIGLYDGEREEFAYSSQGFLQKFLPAYIDAIAFPDFFKHRNDRAECELAVTESGLPILEKSIEYVYIEGEEFDSLAEAKKVLGISARHSSR